jgi:hypothetical protein
MFTVQISDRRTFEAKVDAVGRPVAVVRSATMIPMERAGSIVMHPAVTLDYSLEFDDVATGPTRWTFREVVPTDEQGRVLLTSNLLDRLRINPHTVVKVLQRSGSF